MLNELLTLWSLRRVYALTPEALRDLQERKLRAAVRYAYRTTPLYRERFNEAGIRPEDIRTVADLARLPITTKQDLQTPETRLIVAAGVDPETCIIRRTNGSTGTPLRVYITRRDQQLRSLVEMRSLMRMGLRARDFTVCVGPETPRAKRLHERLGFFANDRISGNLPPEEQLKQLEQMQPSVLWFYPTEMRALMRASKNGLRAHIRPRMLISSAEMLDDLLREQIRDDLGLDPFSAYGANEMGRIATECPAREGLHINVDHVVLEAWKDGKPAAPGEAGSALVTTLNAKGMPLVRYRLGDHIRLMEKPCSCGSPLPLMDLPQGRESDVITLPSGRWVSAFAVSNVLRKHMDIVQFRIVQEAQDRLSMLIAARAPWPPERLRQVEQRTLERLGEPMHVEARLVDCMPDDDIKFRYFVSRVPR